MNFVVLINMNNLSVGWYTYLEMVENYSALNIIIKFLYGHKYGTRISCALCTQVSQQIPVPFCKK
jgi:hypothetical protein